MTNKLTLTCLLTGFLLGTFSFAQTLISHDFNNGQFGPYEVNKSDQESRVSIQSSSVETHWQQDLYNGTNSGRKAQFRPINDIIFTQHIWMGLKLKIHSDYMKDNTNTNAGLMQIWGYNGSSGAANHMCMLKFDGRNGGALVWQHRYNSVANKTHYLVEPNFPRNEFVDVVVHVQLKTKDTGIVQIWVNGELKVNKTNQTIGWGDMSENGMINGTYCFGTSLGQYNYMENASYDDAYDVDNHLFDGHMSGETRTVSYDNVSLYNGADGYALVNPSDEVVVIECDNPSAFSRIEAEDFCEQSGIETDTANTKVGWVDNGDWVKYEGVDFGSGANSISVSVSSGTSGGAIQVRQGSTSGTLLGTLQVPSTGSWDSFETVTTDILNVSGNQDIYFVFTGGSGYLLDVDWFEFEQSTSNAYFTPDPNKTYYLDAIYHNLRLASTGAGEDPYVTSINTTGSNVEWKFIAKGNGYWHIDRAAGGALSRLRTDGTAYADMQSASFSGTYTYYEITEGSIDGTYYLTVVDGPTNKRLQVNNDDEVKMMPTSHAGTWESFLITEVGSTITASFSRIEAEDYDGMNGVQTQATTDTGGGENVGWIHSGDWLLFEDIDLTGAVSLDVRVASKHAGGTIEVRTGSTTGTLIASILVGNTGDDQNWTTLGVDLDSISGTQDVYLVFKGGSGYLFNVNWIEFNNSSTANKEIVVNAEEKQILIYPNPVVSTTKITNASGSILNIYDMNGSVVFTQVISSESETINLSSLNTGVYYGEVTGETEISLVKIIKE